MSQVTVKTNGQTLLVSSTTAWWTSAALALVASTDDDVTTETTITSDTTLYYANTATTTTLTVKQADGTTIFSQPLNIQLGVGPTTINPSPDQWQKSADATPFGHIRKWVSGRYYGPAGAHVPGTNAAGIGVLTVVPIWVPGSYSIDRLVVEATATASTAVARLGVYSSNSDDMPSTLLLDAGTVDISSAAIVSATLDPVLALTKGLYWLAAVSQTASGTMRTLGTAGNGNLVSAASTATMFAGTLGANGYTKSSITGALADFGSTYTATGAAYKVAVRVV